MLCIGDLMLDEFVYGEVSRVSPEAPAPVIAVKRSENIIGGAGNVARNIVSLGARCVFVGVVGDDEAGASDRAAFGKFQGRDRAASHHRPVAADHAQGALRVGTLFDASAARRLGAAAPVTADIEDALIAKVDCGAAARRRGGACPTTPRVC